MKKSILVIAILFVGFTIVGCGNKSDSGQNNSVQDNYPNTTAKDIVYGGTPLAKKFETVKF